MATLEPTKFDAHAPPAVPPPPAAVAAPLPAKAVTPNDVVAEKPVAVPYPPPAATEKIDNAKALAVAEKTPVKKGGSLDRDVALAQVDKDKRLSFIKAWEESEKSKVENKAQKKLSSVSAWENSKRAAVEAQLRKKEEQLEKKKAGYAEKMKNKVALIHKEAEERRAMTEARRGEEALKAEETAAKFRATGTLPKKLCGCIG